jgi:hypothetical protein
MIYEYYCEKCDETFVGEGEENEEHGMCGTICELQGTWVPQASLTPSTARR